MKPLDLALALSVPVMWGVGFTLLTGLAIIVRQRAVPARADERQAAPDRCG